MSEDNQPERLPNGFQIKQCGAEFADESLAMRNEILEDLARDNKRQFYLVDETDDEFRDFFVRKDGVVLGVFRGDELGGVLIASFRKAPLEYFRSLLPRELFLLPDAVCYLELAQVKKAFRGHGFQRALLAEMENRLRFRGVRCLTAIVSPDNASSLHNILKSGFYDAEHFIHQPTGYARIKVVKRLL